MSKKVALDTNEKSELEDAEGLEKKYQSLFISVVWIPLKNVFLVPLMTFLFLFFVLCSLFGSV